jgi:hypothetical protein
MVAAGVLLALLAADVRRWDEHARAGDLRFEVDPAAARWTASSRLPFDPALRLLGLRDQLAFRRAAQRFEAVKSAGNGFDNGVSEVQTRGEVQAQLADRGRAGDARLASAADNLAGILAFVDSRRTGANAPAPVERSVAAFRDAVQLDPANEDAKFNLELLLRQLVARGVRPGSSGLPGGPAKGRRGAGGGLPGRGY